MISVYKGNIIDLDVDIIVNAANKSLLGGGGVDGAIHAAAGKELLKECKRLNGCLTGEAKITLGYNLKAKRIIHTVGPYYKGGKYNEDKLLENCYMNSLKLAEIYRINNKLNNIKIAFPCISTGLYRFPKSKACDIAVSTIKKINNPNIDVIFVCYDELDYKLYQDKIS